MVSGPDRGTGAGTDSGTDPRTDPREDDDVVRREVTGDEARRAARSWWDAEAAAYQAEHGRFLGDTRLVWGPEGLDETAARLLGEVRDRAVLEVGAGAAQGSRWLLDRGGRPVGVDLSAAQLEHARRLDSGRGTGVPLVAADACALPFADASFDLAFSAYGAVQFVADPARLLAEVARVLRPGGRWVASFSHPLRWCFPDDAGARGLVADRSYWDRRAYVEQRDGSATYVETHRTLGDRVRELVAAGLVLVDLVEPEWPSGHDRTWGGWSRLRGQIIPGTAIVVAQRR